MKAKPDEHPDQVRALLARLDEHVRPSKAERGVAEDRMWAAFRAAEAGLSDAPAEWSTGETEIVRLASKRPQPPRWPFLLVAAVVLAVAGLAALATRSTFTDVNAVPALPGETPFSESLDNLGQPPVSLLPGRYEARLLDTNVSFEITETMTLETRDRDSISLLTQGGNTIVVGRPASVFEGQTAMDWFDQNDVNVTPTGEVVEGKRIDIWSANLSDALVAALECGPRQPCLQFGQLETSEPALWLHAGKDNAIVIIPVDGGPDLVVFQAATATPKTTAPTFARTIQVN